MPLWGKLTRVTLWVRPISKSALPESAPLPAVSAPPLARKKPPKSLATGGAGLNMSVTPSDAHAEIKGLDRESQTRRLQPGLATPQGLGFSWDFAGQRPIPTGQEAYRT